MKVLVTDDHNIFRKSFILLLTTMLGPETIFLEAANGIDALFIVDQSQPDIAFLDIHMPLLDGYATFNELRLRYPQIPVIILTQYDDKIVVDHFQCRGAFFLSKGSCEDILEIIQNALEHQVYRPAKVVRKWTSIPKTLQFSNKEIELLRLLSRGYISKEIAVIAGVTEKTASTYRERLLRKTNTKNSTELIALAYKTGFI